MSKSNRTRLNELEAKRTELEDEKRKLRQASREGKAINADDRGGGGGSKGILYELSQDSELNDVWTQRELSPPAATSSPSSALDQELAEVRDKINAEILNIMIQESNEIQDSLERLAVTTQKLAEFSEATDRALLDTKRLLNSLADATEALAIKSDQTNRNVAALNESTHRLISSSQSQSSSASKLGSSSQNLLGATQTLLVFIAILGTSLVFSLALSIFRGLGFPLLQAFSWAIVFDGALALIFLGAFLLVQRMIVGDEGAAAKGGAGGRSEDNT